MMIPKLGVYFRIHLPLDNNITKISALLRFPDQSELSFGEFDSNMIISGKAEAVKKGSPFLGLVLKGIAQMVPVPVAGRILAILEIDNERLACGTLNIAVLSSPPPNASLPPA